MQKIVVDSSVIFKWLYKENENNLIQAEALLKDAVDEKITLLAPELSKYEVGNVLLAAKKLSEKDGKEALDLFYLFPIQFFSETIELAKRTYTIGCKDKLTYYDATFAALALQESASLVTDNPKHHTKISGVKILPLKDYEI